MALALDGSAAFYADMTGDNFTAVTLSTNFQGLIVVSLLYNSATATATSITDTASLTYIKAAGSSVSNNSTNYLEIWAALSGGAQSGNTITVHYSSTAIDFATLHVFGVRDSDGGDSNAALPAIDNSGAADPLSVSTTTPDCFIIGTFRFATTPNPTAGSGWTEIFGSSGGGYLLTQYKIVTSPQSGLSVPVGTGAGDSNLGIAAAAKLAGAAAPASLTWLRYRR